MVNIYKSRWFRTLIILSTICICIILSNTLQADNLSANLSQLFTYIEDPSFHFKEHNDASKEYQIHINFDVLNLVSGEEMQIIFPEQISTVVVIDKTHRYAGNSITITGYLKEFGKQYRISISSSGDAIRIKIRTPDGTIKLFSTSEGSILIDQRNSDRTPVIIDDDVLIPPKPIISETNSPPSRMASLGNTTIDLMILYTAGFAVNYPGSQLAARLNELVAIANTAYSDSAVNVTLNLVHSSQVTYPETTSLQRALNDLTNGISGFSGVDTLRTQYGADLVSFIRPYSSSFSSCGLAWLNGMAGNDISAYAHNGFSAILDGEYSVGSRTYFCTDLTLTHELGHNMGCAHDRANSYNYSPFDGAYSYSYGYGIDGSFGTVMSYINPGLGIFSNPNITSCNGQPCGINENLSNSANNALSLNNSREAIAAFKASVDCPDSNCNSTPAEHLTQTEISQLYIGVFGRASEGSGNTYWQTDPASTSMTVTANVMLNTDPAKAYFGDTLNNNQDFIEHIYSNTLGKTYSEDPIGIDYWVSELDGGKTKGEVIAALIVAAQATVNAGAAQDRFNNKVTVSNYCADNISEYTDLDTFTGFISSVTDATSSVASAKLKIDAEESGSSSSSLCSNTCGYNYEGEYASDGACDDGGQGSSWDGCVLGTDCADCGTR